MSRLAIEGGKPAVSEPLPRFDTIGKEESEAAANVVFCDPLSGFLGGQKHGGFHVRKLEEAWAEKFGVKHAVSCNSATSGILIALMAVKKLSEWHAFNAWSSIETGVDVLTTPYTMSGTVAPAKLLGANIQFGEIDPETYCLRPYDNSDGIITVITVNLFGHPAEIPSKCGPVIVDASQSILASRNGQLISDADITVFSGNVHKQIQCGEGGMCCTNDDGLADKMRMARNHGELAGGGVGLNLRLSEVHAAIWHEQLKKADKIIARRIEIAEQLSEMAKDLGQIPVVKPGYKHSYYIWALKCRRAAWVATALQNEGVPIWYGYVTPLYQLPAFKQSIKREVVEQTNDHILVYENCAWDPTSAHLKQMAEAFKKVTDAQERYPGVTPHRVRHPSGWEYYS